MLTDASSQPFALVAGAGPGLGRALVRRFARGGFRVAALVRPEEDLESFAPELPEALLRPADLADLRALDHALSDVEARMGLPSVLVYNAASGTRGPLLSLFPDGLARDHRVNVLAPLACLRWALPGLKAARGSFLLSGGGLALAPKPGEGAPALGKAAQRSLMLGLAQELAPEVHAALVTIRGFIQPGGPLDPDEIAERTWELHQQEPNAWDAELVLPL